MSARKIKLTIQYDGSGYCGWQTQPGFKTIQQTLNEALFSLVGRKVTVHGASRTDAGVSALGQAGLIELVNCPIPTENFPKAITDRLPPEIVVTDAVEVDRDFKSFASAKDNRENFVRTIFRCEVKSDGDWIYIDIEGDGFLYNMVRNIVGTLVEIGLGRWQPDMITAILEERDRTAAGPIAPPQGLCLMWIKY